MRIWLDDLRKMPVGYDIHVTTAQQAIELLGNKGVTDISLDHDLGQEECGTGYDVALWIERQAFLGFLPPLYWQIHSANPVGRSNIEIALNNADHYWQIEITPEVK